MKLSMAFVPKELWADAITPTHDDLMKAWEWGTARQNASKNLEDQKVSDESGIKIHTQGVLGEMMGCRRLHIQYVFTINTFRSADANHNIEFRSTHWVKGKCKVRPIDNDSRRVMMVLIPKIGDPVYFPGWIMAGDAKKFPKEDKKNAGKPAHWVPQDELRPVEELVEIIRRERE